MTRGRPGRGSGPAITAIGALVLLVALFLPWFHVAGGLRTTLLLVAGHQSPPPTGDAWQVFSKSILLIVVLVVTAVTLGVLAAAGRDDLLRRAAILLTVVGTLTTALVAYKVLKPPGGGLSINNEPQFGAYLGYAAVLTVLLGAALTGLAAPRASAGRAPAAPEDSSASQA